MKHRLEIDWAKVEHPKTFNLDELRTWAVKSIIRQDPCATRDNIADALGISARNVFRILKSDKLSELKECAQIMNATEYLRQRGYTITKTK